MESLVRRDDDLGRHVFKNTQSAPLLRHIASIISLSVDEAVWFIAPLALALVHASAKQLGLYNGSPYANEFPVSFFFEIFNNSISLCLLAGLLKLLTQRSRPSYAVQEKYHIPNGDRYSFPSGHTMFAAAMSRVYLSAGAIWTCLPCIALVGWSRVAKGRHFPSDVFAGAVCGLLIAEIPLRGYALEWSRIKFLVLSLSFFEVALAAAVPRFRTPGVRAGAVFLAIAYALLPWNVTPPLGDYTVMVSVPAVIFLAFCTEPQACSKA